MASIEIKTASEIELMRTASLLASDTLAYLAGILRPGLDGGEIDKTGEEYIRDHGAVPGFLGYRGFPGSLCISINECVVHGIPNGYELQEGDVISIDCGILKDGFYGDVAFTFAIAPLTDEVKKLLEVTRECLDLAVEQAIVGNRIGDIGYAVQHHAEKVHGYGVVRELVGHGLGRNLHEKPDVPNYGRRGSGQRLKEDMAIAIEPMVNLGTRKIKQLRDGWGIVTKDGKASAHYEHDVIIKPDQADVLSDHDRIDREVKRNDNLQYISRKK